MQTSPLSKSSVKINVTPHLFMGGSKSRRTDYLHAFDLVGDKALALYSKTSANRVFPPPG